MTSEDEQNDQLREPLVYRDIHVRLGRYDGRDGGGAFRVWVEGEAPGGTMRPDDAICCVFDPGRFWNNPEAGFGGLVGKLERRSLPEPQLYNLGALLAELVLPEGQVRVLFNQSLARLGAGEGLRLRLHIDVPPLLRLPWEYLALPEASGPPQPTDFLALRREVSIVRTDTVEAPARDLPARDHVVLVGALSNPEDQPELRVDKDRLHLEAATDALNQSVGRKAVRLRWCEQPTTREALARALADGADVFHFAGHGRFSSLTNVGTILLETNGGTTDEYPSAELAQLVRASGVRLAVLGACDTGRRDGENVWSGVASALTRQRVRAVIGNQFTIEDQNAELLAAYAYPLLFAGFSVDEALSAARQAIFQRAGLANRDWGAPVLYLGDRDGVLFPLPSAEATEETAGPFLLVANSFKRVQGRVIDVDIDKAMSGRVEVRDEVDVVEKDGEFTSVRINQLGGPSRASGTGTPRWRRPPGD